MCREEKEGLIGERQMQKEIYCGVKMEHIKKREEGSEREKISERCRTECLEMQNTHYSNCI